MSFLVLEGVGGIIVACRQIQAIIKRGPTRKAIDEGELVIFTLSGIGDVGVTGLTLVAGTIRSCTIEGPVYRKRRRFETILFSAEGYDPIRGSGGIATLTMP